MSGGVLGVPGPHGEEVPRLGDPGPLHLGEQHRDSGLHGEESPQGPGHLCSGSAEQASMWASFEEDCLHAVKPVHGVPGGTAPAGAMQDAPPDPGTGDPAAVTALASGCTARIAKFGGVGGTWSSATVWSAGALLALLALAEF